MVRIRLRRVGKKKQASFRVVVADQRSPRDGRFIETIGFYNPRTDPPIVKINEERALYWLSQGAQPSEAVARLLGKQGTLDRFARLKEGEDLEALLAEAAKEIVPVEEVKGAPPEVSLAELGLSKRVQNLLEGAGITSAKGILARLEEGEEGLLAIEGFGPKSLGEVEEKLVEHGLIED